jgi:hypothetical protein
VPSLNDFFNKLTDVDNHLQQIDSDLTSLLSQVNTNLQQVNNHLVQLVAVNTNGFNNLTALELFADQVLLNQTRQLDTVICILEHISRNTCGILTETHQQTALDRAIDRSASTLTQLYETVHADAALAFERMRDLQRQLEACCPPKPEPPACTYEPCPAPPPFRGEPPQPRPQDVPPRQPPG